MRRNFLFVIVVLCLLGLLAEFGWFSYEHRKLTAGQLPGPAAQGQPASSSANAAPQSAAALIGKPAPAFTLEDTTGKKVSLADYKGKPLLINFWATWCGPCKIETPWLVELRNQYAAQGFEVLGVSMDDLDRGNPHALSQEKQAIARFAQQMHISYPVLIGGDSISDSYGGLDDLPTSFYVNRRGIVTSVSMGIFSKDEIEGNIKKALGK